MKVYLVTYNDYDISKNYAAFSTLEKAQEYVDNYTVPEDSFGPEAKGPGDLYIEELTLDPN